MKYSELISGIFWLVFGIILTILATRYQIGSVTQPGPGFLPLGLGFLLIFFSLIILVQTRKSFLNKEKEKVQSFSKPGGLKKVGSTVLILLLIIFLFEKIGYLFTVFLLMVFLMLVAELKSWKKILFLALITTLGVYLVFAQLLEQQLPRGFLRF